MPKKNVPSDIIQIYDGVINRKFIEVKLNPNEAALVLFANRAYPDNRQSITIVTRIGKEQPVSTLLDEIFESIHLENNIKIQIVSNQATDIAQRIIRVISDPQNNLRLLSFLPRLDKININQIKEMACFRINCDGTLSEIKYLEEKFAMTKEVNRCLIS